MMISIELKLYRCPLNWTIHNLGYNFVYSPHGREEGCWLSTPKSSNVWNIFTSIFNCSCMSEWAIYIFSNMPEKMWQFWEHLLRILTIPVLPKMKSPAIQVAFWVWVLDWVQSVYSKCSFIWFVSSLNLAGWSVNANFNKCALLNSNVCVLSLFIYIIVGGYRIFNE